LAISIRHPAGPSYGRFHLGERLWHKSGVNSFRKGRRAPPPLDQAKLEELALRYVGKYATTRAKLRSYLARKVRERGWQADREPDFEGLANRFAELGYIDDASYALGQSRSLSARGFGKRRLADKLRVAGVDEADSGAAHAHADGEAVTAALRLAERRRIGPFAAAQADREQQRKWIAAMIRAGHSFALARAIAAIPPGAAVDFSELRNRAGLSED
jgi:regulatory protein